MLRKVNMAHVNINLLIINNLQTKQCNFLSSYIVILENCYMIIFSDILNKDYWLKKKNHY